MGREKITRLRKSAEVTRDGIGNEGEALDETKDIFLV